MDKKYKINKKFIIQKLDGKTVIFDGEKSVLFSLNETASFMFQKIKAGWDREKIVSTLVKTYAVQKKKVEEDLNKMINDLVKKRVLL